MIKNNSQMRGWEKSPETSSLTLLQYDSQLDLQQSGLETQELEIPKKVKPV